MEPGKVGNDYCMTIPMDYFRFRLEEGGHTEGSPDNQKRKITLLKLSKG
jgi:hypothetical protein